MVDCAALHRIIIFDAGPNYDEQISRNCGGVRARLDR